MTREEQIRHIVDEALNAACSLIQERLGVDSGDVAGVHFSGDDNPTILDLTHYVEVELAIGDGKLPSPVVEG